MVLKTEISTVDPLVSKADLIEAEIDDGLSLFWPLRREYPVAYEYDIYWHLQPSRVLELACELATRYKKSGWDIAIRTMRDEHRRIYSVTLEFRGEVKGSAT
jgi:hypothetical protein